MLKMVHGKTGDSAIDEIYNSLLDFPVKTIENTKNNHWIKTDDYVCGDYKFICSSCNEEYWESASFEKRAHFCPNCGVKMAVIDENTKKYISRKAVLNLLSEMIYEVTEEKTWDDGWNTAIKTAQDGISKLPARRLLQFC